MRVQKSAWLAKRAEILDYGFDRGNVSRFVSVLQYFGLIIVIRTCQTYG